MRHLGRKFISLMTAVTLMGTPAIAWAEPTETPTQTAASAPTAGETSETAQTPDGAAGETNETVQTPDEAASATEEATPSVTAAPEQTWGTEDAPVRTADTSTRTLTDEDGSCMGEDPEFLRATPDGETLFLIAGTTVCTIDTESFTAYRVTNLPGQVMGVESSITLSADGSHLFIMTTGGLAVIDTLSGEPSVIDLLTTNFCISPDGTRVWAIISDNGAWTLIGYTVTTGQTTATTPLDTSSLGDTVSSLGIYSISPDGSLILADAQLPLNEELVSIDALMGTVTKLADISTGYLGRISADGTQIFLPSTGVHDVLVADTATGDVTVIFVDSQTRLLSLIPSADNSTLAITSSRGGRIYDAAKGTLIRNLAPNEPAQYITGDGSHVLSADMSDGGELTVSAAARDSEGVTSASLGAADWNNGEENVSEPQIYDALVSTDGKTLYLLIHQKLAHQGSANSETSSAGTASASPSSSSAASQDSAARLIAVDLTTLTDDASTGNDDNAAVRIGVIVAVICVIVIAIVIAVIVIVHRKRRR